MVTALGGRSSGAGESARITSSSSIGETGLPRRSLGGGILKESCRCSISIGVGTSKGKFDALVIDGANRQAVEEMRRRHGLPLLSADKTGKSDFIELMNAEFILGRLKLITADCSQGLQNSGRKAQEQESLALHDEYQGLVWDERALARGKREEHLGCPNHLADAALYAWRHCYQYLSRAPERPPEPYSPEWFRREAERMHEEEIEEMLARKGEETVGLGDSENWESWTH